MTTVWNDGNEPDPADINDRHRFGQALTTLRERAGWTVRDIARLVDIPVATAGDYFAGRSVPPVKMAKILPAILRVCGETDPARIDQWRCALIRVRRIGGTPADRAPVPYPGLVGFGIDQAEWFFGRDDVVGRVIRGLAGHRAAGTPLAVVGGRASGKSSLLRAGVLPRLGSAGGTQLLLTPGPDPCRRLADRLRGVAGAPADPVDHAVHADPARLGTILQQGGVRPETTTLLVDQFEGLFTPDIDEAVRRAFLAALAALRAAGMAVVVALCSNGPVSSGQDILVQGALADPVPIAPMDDDALCEAIVRPAERANSTVAPDLVGRLVTDVRIATRDMLTDPLPLLSHSLFMAWRHRKRRPLTLADYRATGCLRGSVGRAFELAVGPLRRRHSLTDDVFRALTVADGGGRRIRRAVARTDIVRCAAEAAPDEVTLLLRRLASHRLITLDADTAEIAHDAVLDAWIESARVSSSAG